MKYDIFSTAKHTIIYSLGNISIKAVGFILLPLYTSHLSVSDFGILGLLEAFFQFSTTVFSFKLSTAMIRWIASEDSLQKQKSIIFTALAATIALVTPIILLLNFFRENLSILFFNSNTYSDYFLIVNATILSEIILFLILDIIRIRQKSLLYLFFTITKVVLNLGIVIYLVKELNMGIKGIIYSQLISSLIVLTISSPVLLKNINFNFNIKIFKKMFMYGFPLVFSTISSLVLTLADRFYLKAFYSFADVGIYNLSYKISSVINLIIIQSFQLGFLPIAYKKYEEGNSKHFFAKILKYYTSVLMISILSISYFSKELIILLSEKEEYYIAYYYVPIIALVFYIKGIHYNFSLGLHFVKKTQYNTFVVLTGAIINLILNYLLVPLYGIWGATMASIIASIVILLLFYKYSQKYFKVDYDILRLFTLTATGIIFILIGYYLNTLSLMYAISLKLISLVSFIAALYYLHYFTKDEINEINKTILKVKGILKRDKVGID